MGGACDGSLAIEFLAFEVNPQQKSIELSWDVISNNAISHYEILRSTDKQYFEKIGTQSSLDYTINQQSYIDKQVKTNQLYYYQIKVVENSGKVSYSVVKSAKIDGNLSDIVLYPNPAKDLITIGGLEDNERATVCIYDALGRKVATKTLEEMDVTLNISELYKGVYMFEVRQGDRVDFEKVLIMR